MTTDEILHANLEMLREENLLLKTDAANSVISNGPGSRTGLFVGAVIALSVLAVLSILAIFFVRPDKDNTALIALVLGFLVPAVTAFLAAAVQQLHVAVNSRLTQLVLLTAKARYAEGRLAEKTSAAAAAAAATDVPSVGVTSAQLAAASDRSVNAIAQLHDALLPGRPKEQTP